MSLPYLLGLEQIRQPLELHVPVTPLAEIAEAPGLKVGVCWQGSRKHERDAERSIPKDLFWHVLAKTENVSFFSIQLGERCDGCATSLEQHINDFYDTANLVQQLDLVITVDTSVAHLSATLGVPTWVLVTHVPDWRWGIASETSPWYPAVRIFRQPVPGDWPAALADVKVQLRRCSK
jgi:ADP-heptose:LPS heptosyltransferase